MNCQTCREMFPDHVGEELDRESIEEFRKHVNSCESCRQELELLDETQSVLRAAWGDESIPERLVFDRPGSVTAHPGLWAGLGRPPRLAWFSLAAAACLILCVGALAFVNARFQVGEDGFSLSFGPEPPVSIIRQPAVPVRLVAEPEAQFRRLLEQRIGQLEQSYGLKLQEAVARMENQWETQRSLDLRQVHGDLSYLERLQEVVRQRTDRNEVLISSVADHYIRSRSEDSVP